MTIIGMAFRLARDLYLSVLVGLPLWSVGGYMWGAFNVELSH